MNHIASPGPVHFNTFPNVPHLFTGYSSKVVNDITEICPRAGEERDDLIPTNNIAWNTTQSRHDRIKEYNANSTHFDFESFIPRAYLFGVLFSLLRVVCSLVIVHLKELFVKYLNEVNEEASNRNTMRRVQQTICIRFQKMNGIYISSVTSVSRLQDFHPDKSFYSVDNKISSEDHGSCETEYFEANCSIWDGADKRKKSSRSNRDGVNVEKDRECVPSQDHDGVGNPNRSEGHQVNDNQCTSLNERVNGQSIFGSDNPSGSQDRGFARKVPRKVGKLLRKSMFWKRRRGRSTDDAPAEH